MLIILMIFINYVSCNIKQPGLIYILELTNSPENGAYLSLEMGQEAFKKRRCFFENCFITNDRSYFDNVSNFDVLLFNAIYIQEPISTPPQNRSESQLYIFVGLEPAAYHHVPSDFDGIFNMTLSYKLTADIVYPYFLVRNNRGEIIGPRKDMHWEYDIKDMAPADNDIVYKLRHKHIAAAVVVSNCNALSNRYEFITELKEELLKYGQQVHVYGECKFATLDCPRLPVEKSGLITTCASKIESAYYFYLAFENSFCEDYVSEKLLHGLNHFAVPVVYGAANYTRFMPDGIYLNARTLGVEALAKEMNGIINDPQKYLEFFKWHGYYTFHDNYGYQYNDSYAVCNICAKLNKRIQSKRRTVYKYIAEWWNDYKEETNDIQYTTPYIEINEFSEKPSFFSDHGFISELYDILAARYL